MSRRPRGEEGYALATALLVIFLLAVALSLLAASLNLRLRTTIDDAQRVHLSALSDAALAEALANLAQRADYRGSPAHAFGGGTLTSRVERLSSDLYGVEATATYKGRQRVVRTVVFRTPGTASVRRWRRRRG